VNADGWALTCKHVAVQMADAHRLLAKFDDFKTRRKDLRGHKRKYDYSRIWKRRLGSLGGV
jgi:hypothetical protein